MTCVMGNNCFVTVFIVKMARLYGYILLPLLPSYATLRQRGRSFITLPESCTGG